jgi:hypothetical protein
MQKPKSMDQLKPSFGNRSHYCFTCEAKIWHMLQCGYWRVDNINFFYASSHFYFPSYLSLYSSSSTYHTLRHIPSLYILKYPSLSTFDFLFLPFHRLLSLHFSVLPLVFYIVYHHIFCPSSPTSCLTLFPSCVPASDNSYLTRSPNSNPNTTKNVNLP